MSLLRPWLAPCLLLGVGMVALVDAALGGDLVGGVAVLVVTVVASYLVGARQPRAAAAVISGSAAVMLTVANQVADPGRYSAANDLFFFAVLVGGVALAGNLVSARAAQVRELRTLSAIRAEQRVREVEAARLEERTRLDAGVTRAMMQRMSAVVVQAAGVRREGAHARDRHAVALVESGGRATLQELREVLGSLHAPADLLDEQPADTPEPQRTGLGWVDVVVGCSGIPVAVECVASSASQGPAIANVVAGVALGLPLVWRRTHPLLSGSAFLGLVALMASLLTPLGGTVTILLPLSLVAYALGAHTRGPRRGAALGLLLGGGLLVALLGSWADAGAAGTDGLVPSLVWMGLAFGAGVLAAQHTDRAARLADLLGRVEAGREDEVRLAVAEQRQALARDLHDTVAHAMTVVCLHAEAAQQQWSDETAVAQSLAVIESAAREAMGHLRVGLGVLETEVEAGAQLHDELTAFAASLGVPVTVSDSDSTVLSPSEVPLVRRLVREALVNVARHAKGSPAHVLITHGSDQLVIEVTNPASQSGRFTSGSQRGLTGLHELCSAHGGRLEHGTTSEGGYRVAAYLPPAHVAVPA
jgi:signal transduction histidine kinase